MLVYFYLWYLNHLVVKDIPRWRDFPLLDDKNTSAFNRERQNQTFQMMADHGDLCEGADVTYCLNGGTCYKIASMDTLTCVCDGNYKGSRCEQFQLFSSSTSAGRAGLIAAVVIVALLILLSVALIIYYIRKMLKAKQQRQQSTPHQYWRVKPRV